MFGEDAATQILICGIAASRQTRIKALARNHAKASTGKKETKLTRRRTFISESAERG
jgi:hypothetical protein